MLIGQKYLGLNLRDEYNRGQCKSHHICITFPIFCLGNEITLSALFTADIAAKIAVNFKKRALKRHKKK